MKHINLFLLIVLLVGCGSDGQNSGGAIGQAKPVDAIEPSAFVAVVNSSEFDDLQLRVAEGLIFVAIENQLPGERLGRLIAHLDNKVEVVCDGLCKIQIKK